MTRIMAYGVNAHGETGGFSGNHLPSVHYRYGYQIGSSKPRYVGQEEERGHAVREAKAKASEVVTKLKELGAPTQVAWWIQKRTLESATTYDEPVIEAVQ